jgi:hypothetical protein
MPIAPKISARRSGGSSLSWDAAARDSKRLGTEEQRVRQVFLQVGRQRAASVDNPQVRVVQSLRQLRRADELGRVGTRLGAPDC